MLILTFAITVAVNDADAVVARTTKDRYADALTSRVLNFARTVLVEAPF